MFEWDARKAATNADKREVTFEAAVTVFGDPNALDGLDARHSEGEPRFRRVGRAATGRVLVVSYTLRRLGDAENIRIISARQANRKERTEYFAAQD